MRRTMPERRPLPNFAAPDPPANPTHSTNRGPVSPCEPGFFVGRFRPFLLHYRGFEAKGAATPSLSAKVTARAKAAHACLAMP